MSSMPVEGEVQQEDSLPHSVSNPAREPSNLTIPTSYPSREASGIGEREDSAQSRLTRARPPPLEDLGQTNSTKKGSTGQSLFSGSATRFFQAVGVRRANANVQNNSTIESGISGGNLTVLSEEGTHHPSEGTGLSEDMRRTTRFAEEKSSVIDVPRAQSFWERGGLPRGRIARVLTRASVARMQFGAQEKARTAIMCTIVCLIFWFILSSALLILFGWQYYTHAVAEDMARFAEVTADRAAASAATVLATGLAARDALDLAIKSKRYFEPLDYETVRATLEPVFAGFALLRSVDLAFSDRESYITTRRMVNDSFAVGSFMSMDNWKINELERESALAMQSSAADCAKLGDRGCLNAAPAQSQRWYGFASHLWAGEEADPKDAADLKSVKVFTWDDRPGFVARRPSRALATSTSVEWLPAYSLLFRIPFPGSRGQLSVFGRSVIELSGLRVIDSLHDEKLGTSGAIYICDNRGLLLAAVQAGIQVSVTPKSGVFRFRYVHELQTAWSSKLKDFDGTAKKITIDQFYIVVHPLMGRGLSNFTAVIVAEKKPFIDTRLSPMITFAQVLVVLPYPFVMLVSGLYLLHRERKRKRNLRRGTVLREGIDTLNDMGETLDESFPEVSETMNALRKRTLAKTIMAQREAEQSMRLFLEESAKPGEEVGQHLALVEYHKPV